MKEQQRALPPDGEPCGIVVVDKPEGLTSHDVVARLRKRFGTRRVGHTGTLDPIATGVLVACVGRATRLIEYLPHEPKEYEAEIQLGIETDSQDVTGRAVAVRDASALTLAELTQALGRFRGSILQTPPMVSAVKVGGIRLYRLAQRGAVIERQPRSVFIHEIELRGFSPGRVAAARLRIVCSSGTYIRALAHDLGRTLGVGGAMSALRRTRVGPFSLEAAEPLDECSHVQPVETVLSDWPLAEVHGKTLEALLCGRPVAIEDVTWVRRGDEGSRVLVTQAGGLVVAVATIGQRRLIPAKVLAPSHESLASRS